MYESPELRGLFSTYSNSKAPGRESIADHLSLLSLAEHRDDTLIVATATDLAVYPGGGAPPQVQGFRINIPGFTELTAISHLGPAIASIVAISLRGEDELWRRDAQRLLDDTERVRAANGTQLWRESLGITAFEGREERIAAMVDYACAISERYLVRARRLEVGTAAYGGSGQPSQGHQDARPGLSRGPTAELAGVDDQITPRNHHRAALFFPQHMTSLNSMIKTALAYLPSPLDYRVTEFARGLTGTVRQARRRTTRIFKTIGGPEEVVAGPFRGMRYPLRFGAQGGLLPKLLGTYERELHPALEQLWEHPFSLVDIGAAEGYYAVGWAIRQPTARVVAFEMDRVYHTAIRQMAVANGVASRIELRGTCTTDQLERALSGFKGGSVLVLSDCEGAEGDLLDPSAVPSLRRATIVCEVHEAIRPGVSDLLRGRFKDTHLAQAIPTRARTSGDLPPGVSMSDEDAVFSLDEGRSGPMEWFIFTPLEGSSR